VLTYDMPLKYSEKDSSRPILPEWVCSENDSHFTIGQTDDNISSTNAHLIIMSYHYKCYVNQNKMDKNGI